MATTTATTFTAEICGKSYNFVCSVVNGGKGLTHVCKDDDGRTTRVVWGGRTWENFEFATVLQRAFKKYPLEVRTALEMKILVQARQAEEKKADDLMAEFQTAYNGLSDRNKEVMRNYPLLNTPEDAHRCIGFMKMLALFQ